MFDLFKSGGIVMWPLLFISITSLACIFERFTYWNEAFVNNGKKLILTVEKYSSISSVDYIKQNQISSIPLETVLLDALKIIDQSLVNDTKNIDIKLALEISIQSIQSEFGKFSNLFSTIITISPLLGLLGTVLGLINSFTFIKLGEAGANV